MNLQTPLTQLNRVGKTLGQRLKRLGLITVQDLLFYFPFRYEDFSQVKKIKDLKDGDEVSVRGKIELIASKRSFRKRKIITEAVVADDTERMKVIWFGQPFISKILKQGDEVFLSGKVTSDMFGFLMKSPSYEKVNQRPHPNPLLQGEGISTTHTARLVPIYSLTAGITNKQMRFLMSQVICIKGRVKEWLPDDIMEKADLVPVSEAVRGIHFPIDEKDLKQAEKRLKFGELFLMQLHAEMVRQSLKKLIAPKIEFKEKETREFVASLPFQLTKKQKVAAWEILQDMEKAEPMNRLLEGDVGSGKTVVAAMAMYNAGLNGFQTALMAPTEILAIQHTESLQRMFGDKVGVCLLTRSKYCILDIKYLGDKNIQYPISNIHKVTKKQVIEKIQNGDIKIIIGTHALLSEKIEFKNLGLVIVDEQHRFGVEQRKILKEKMSQTTSPLTPLLGKERGTVGTPHFLSMTATPIPRSFALTIRGDLDLSILDEMPPGRKPVKTRLVEPRNRQKAYDFIRVQVKQGRQAFVICPLIKANDEEFQISNFKFQNDDKKTVLSEYEKLSKQIFPDLKIGFLHGKMPGHSTRSASGRKSQSKDEVMKDFSERKIDILVSTSVVEVGVNIPNASVMMIECAEKFGLAQLHQFRGRVGRAEHQSYCFLFSDTDSEKALERLKFFEKENNGFKVAEYDLEVRGPGQVYGSEQSGMEQFKIATLHDHDLIKQARDIAREIDFDKYPELRDKVERFESSVHLE